MPQVPIQTTPDVSLSAGMSPNYQAPSITPMKSGTGEQIEAFGKEETAAGSVLMMAAERHQNAVDDASVKEADNNLTQSTMDTLGPYLQLSGKDALQAAPGTKLTLAQSAQKLQETLTNPVQKFMFQQVAARRIAQANDQVQQHQLTQGKAYDLTETQKRAEVNRNATIAQWGTWQMPDSPYETAKKVTLNSVDEVLQKQGVPLDSAIAQEAHLAASTDIHMNVIGQMLTAQKTGDAKAYYDKYQDEIDPRRWDDIGRSLKSQSAASDGIQMAMVLAPKLADTDVETLRDQLYKQAGGGTESFKPDTFQVASAQLDAMYSRHKLAGQENRDQLSIPVWQGILNAEAKGGKMSPSQLGTMPEFQAMKMSSDPETVKAAAAISDHVWGEYHSLQSEQRQEARANKAASAQDRLAIAQEKLAKQEEQRGNLTELQLNPDRIAQMSDAEVAQTAAQLGPKYGPTFMGLRKQVASPEALAKVTIPAEMTKDAMARLGISSKTTRGAEFVESINSFISSQQQEQKHVFNHQQMRQAIAYATAKVATKDTTWTRVFGANTSQFRYQITDPSQIVIPKQQNDQINGILRQQGISDTPHNRVRILDAINAESKLNGGK